MSKGKKKGRKPKQASAPQKTAAETAPAKKPAGFDPNLPVPSEEANPAAALIFVAVIIGLIGAAIAVQFLTR